MSHSVRFSTYRGNSLLKSFKINILKINENMSGKKGKGKGASADGDSGEASGGSGKGGTSVKVG